MRRMGFFFLLTVGMLLVTIGRLCAQTDQDLLAVHEEMKQSLNTHDLDRLMAVWTEDCVYDYAAAPQSAIGKEQIRQFFVDLFTGFPDFHVEQRQIVVSGNIMVTECITNGALLGNWMGFPPTSLGADKPHMHLDIYEFEGNKIKKITTYIDIATLLINVGLMPTLHISGQIGAPIRSKSAPCFGVIRQGGIRRG
jgi:steroid delta-isomerase-like uncharacterized protein